MGTWAGINKDDLWGKAARGQRGTGRGYPPQSRRGSTSMSNISSK